MSLITIDKLINFHNTRRTSFDRQEAKNKNDEKEKVELKYIYEYTNCTLETTIKENLTTINIENIQNLIANNFYNSAVMQFISCLVISLAKYSSDTSVEDATIHYWLKNIKAISTESLEGYVMTTDLERIKDIFILKAPKYNYSLIHELFVGFFGTNLLRQYIPNFAYIYGYLNCSSPFIKNKSEVATWCHSGKKNVQYIMYENIYPSMTMKQFLENCSFTNFLNAYLQILYSLDLASKEIGFTHYDLHTSNVLIRIIDQIKNFYIPYQTNNGIIYLKSYFIATIIDYGFSQIEYNDTNYFNHSVKYAITEKPFPLHDAFRFLVDSFARTDQTKNYECRDNIYTILKFFDSIDSKTRWIEQYNKNIHQIHNLPFSEKIASITISDLINYIKHKFPKDITFLNSQTNERIPTLHCQEECISLSQIGKNFSTHAPIAHNIFEFYDLMELNDPLLLEKIAKNFDYHVEKIKHMQQINKL